MVSVPIPEVGTPARGKPGATRVVTRTGPGARAVPEAALVTRRVARLVEMPAVGAEAEGAQPEAKWAVAR